jgi:hypothetical protein
MLQQPLPLIQPQQLLRNLRPRLQKLPFQPHLTRLILPHQHHSLLTQLLLVLLVTRRATEALLAPRSAGAALALIRSLLAELRRPPPRQPPPPQQLQRPGPPTSLSVWQRRRPLQQLQQGISRVH